MNFVGDDYFLERDFLGAQFFDQISGLLERHVAIVVAMNKEHGRAPVQKRAAYAGTNSILTLRPSDLAARLSVARVTDVFSGSSNR